MSKQTIKKKTPNDKFLPEHDIKDAVNNTVQTTATALGLSVLHINDCISAILPKDKSSAMQQLQTASLSFDISAGLFAGYRGTIKTSLAFYAATLMPDIYDAIDTSDLDEAGKRIVAKTLLYGTSYVIGWCIGRINEY